MGNTVVTVITIFIAAILMFVFPLMAISERNDDITQQAVEVSVQEFVDEATTKGKITADSYEKLISDLNATGNTYEVSMEVQILDENPGKKTTTTSGDLIGENVRYSVFTTTIEQELTTKGVYNLKKGDIVIVTAKNTSQTLAQTLRNFMYKVTGSSYQIGTSASGMVINTGI